MTDIIEDIYIHTYYELNRLVLPPHFKNPDNNIFLTRASACNAISELGSALNKIAILLGKGRMDYMKYIKKIRDLETNRHEQLVTIIYNFISDFHAKKGELMNTILLEIDSLRTIPDD